MEKKKLQKKFKKCCRQALSIPALVQYNSLFVANLKKKQSDKSPLFQVCIDWHLRTVSKISRHSLIPNIFHWHNRKLIIGAIVMWRIASDAGIGLLRALFFNTAHRNWIRVSQNFAALADSQHLSLVQPEIDNWSHRDVANCFRCRNWFASLLILQHCTP